VHRFRIEGHPEITALQFRTQIISLALLEPQIPNDVRLKYWQWFDTALLEQVKDEHRELYRSIIQHARGIIAEAYASVEERHSNAQ